MRCQTLLHVFHMQRLVLYDYTNKEKDIITQAFRANNCISYLLILRSVPSILA